MKYIILLVLLLSCTTDKPNKFYYIGCAQYGFTTQEVINNCGGPSDYTFSKDKEKYFYYMSECIEVLLEKQKVTQVTKCS